MVYRILYSEASRNQIKRLHPQIIEKGQILLKPRKLIDPSQGWHWTKAWQKKEDEADKEIEQDELSPEFKKADEGIKWLKE